MKDNRKQQYWATKPIDEIASEIQAKFDSYKDFILKSGYLHRIKSCYEAFYNIKKNGSLHITRNQDDVAELSVNHFKSLTRRLHILVTENKLAFQPRSNNSDVKSSIQSDLARGIVEYYNNEKNMSSVLTEAVLGALIMMEYYIYAPWSFAEGFELTTDNNQIIKTGDQQFVSLSALDVAKSTSSTKTDYYYILREKKNKYDLASQFPNFASEIIADSINLDEKDYILSTNQNLANDDETENYVYCFTFFHSRTPSLPNGRKTVVCSGQVLSDGPLEYSQMPVFRISAGEMIQTMFADSPTTELVSLQEGLDALWSAITTNSLNNSIQMIYSADPNLTTRKLGNGQTLVTSASPPVGLNLSATSGESFKIIDMIVQVN
jgi:hypothetical protein